MTRYLTVFLISMIPILELRFAVPIAVGMGLPYLPALITCVLGNMLPVPFIYFFARKLLVWGSGKRYIHKICKFFLEKGEKWSFSGAAAVCGYPHSRHRGLDRHSGCQLSGSWHQNYCRRRFAGRDSGRNHYGCSQRQCFSHRRIIIWR